MSVGSIERLLRVVTACTPLIASGCEGRDDTGPPRTLSDAGAQCPPGEIVQSWLEVIDAWSGDSEQLAAVRAAVSASGAVYIATDGVVAGDGGVTHAGSRLTAFDSHARALRWQVERAVSGSVPQGVAAIVARSGSGPVWCVSEALPTSEPGLDSSPIRSWCGEYSQEGSLRAHDVHGASDEDGVEGPTLLGVTAFSDGYLQAGTTDEPNGTDERALQSLYFRNVRSGGDVLWTRYYEALSGRDGRSQVNTEMRLSAIGPAGPLAVVEVKEPGAEHYALLAFDADVSLRWESPLGDVLAVEPNALAVTSDGESIVALTRMGQPHLLKFNAKGRELWDVSLDAVDGSALGRVPTAITLDDDEQIWLAYNVPFVANDGEAGVRASIERRRSDGSVLWGSEVALPNELRSDARAVQLVAAAGCGVQLVGEARSRSASNTVDRSVAFIAQFGER